MKTSQWSLTAHSDLENPQLCQESGSRGEKTPKFSSFPLKPLFEIFPNVSDIFLPCLPLVHLIPARLSLPNRAQKAPDSHHAPSSSISPNTPPLPPSYLM